jgi:hypothetical protein
LRKLATEPQQADIIQKHDQWGRLVLVRQLKEGKHDITAGTIEALVEALAEDAPPDTLYIEVFLLTFRHFTTAAHVLELLHKRFRIKTADERADKVVRIRAITVLKKWAERHYYDFRFPEVQTLLSAFLDSISKSDCAKFGDQIKAIIDAELQRAKTFAKRVAPRPPKQLAELLESMSFMNEAFPAKRIAQELILEDLRLFKQIKPDEFCIFL